MRDQVDTFRHLMRANRLDVKAIATAFDKLPANAGAEVTVVVDQARRSIAAVRKGDKRYKPLLRHAIGRLVVLLEERVAADMSKSD